MKRPAVVDWTLIETRELLGRRYTAAMVDSPEDDRFVESFAGSWSAAVRRANMMQAHAERAAGRKLPSFAFADADRREKGGAK